MSKIDLERFAEYDNMYRFVDELYKPDSTVPIILTDENFNGTVLRYDRIDMKSMNADDGEATLSFHYEFIQNPHKIGKHNARFNNHIGDILVNIIINSLNGKQDENREDDSEQSDTQRELFPKGTPFSK
tara:strand:- start:962 stop:1348 length:387 start_codon:yes stop_codon:yes gene_type:complete